MLIEAVSRRYAKALFNASVSQKSQDTVERELEKVENTFDRDQRLYQIWASPRLFPETKKSFFKKIFPECSALVFRFMCILIDKKRENILLPCIREYRSMLLDFYNRVFVEIKTAVPISEEIQTQLKEVLSQKLAKQVGLILTLDPSLIGGMAIRVGDRVLDGSLKTKLQELKEELLRS
jgi:F-type H+-transporting ATPase subunit delta